METKLTKKGQKLRAAWIEALESGRYKQTTGDLRKRVDGKLQYCCLGVLCNIRDNSQWYEPEHPADNVARKNFAYGGADCGTDEPPVEVTQLVGLTDTDVGNLIALNDEDKLSFKEIAARLRENNLDPAESSDE